MSTGKTSNFPVTRPSTLHKDAATAPQNGTTEPSGALRRLVSNTLSCVAVLGIGLAASVAVPTAASSSTTAATPNGQSQSTIWAGYAASTGATYRWISASWTVPTVICIPGNDVPAVAQWVGLDGYGTSSVEQAGTGMKCINGGHPSYWAWSSLPQAVDVRVPYPVAAGDVMSVSVEADTPTTFEVLMSNTSASHQSWTWGHTGSAPSRTSFPVSAEVIMEAVPINGVAALVPTTSVVFTDIAIALPGGGLAGFDTRFFWDQIVLQTSTSRSTPGPMSANGTAFEVPSSVPQFAHLSRLISPRQQTRPLQGRW